MDLEDRCCCAASRCVIQLKAEFISLHPVGAGSDGFFAAGRTAKSPGPLRNPVEDSVNGSYEQFSRATTDSEESQTKLSMRSTGGGGGGKEAGEMKEEKKKKEALRTRSSRFRFEVF